MGAPDSDAVVIRRLASPVGSLLAGVTTAGLCMLEFDEPARLPAQRARIEKRFGPMREGEAPLLDQTEAELAEYFAGRRQAFGVPLALAGSEFMLSVWRALVTIPYGTTVSYGELARRLGRPGAQRAVGLANGRNPITIVVPCHRVIEQGGGLRGYGGGLWRKRFLLDLERRVAAPDALAGTPLGEGTPDR